MRYLCPYIPTVRIFFWKAIDQASTFCKRMLCALEQYFNWTGKIYTIRFENMTLLDEFYNLIARTREQIESM